MRIGEAAARTGVTRDTLRYYERHGLLPRASRTSAGYREYSDAIVDRVRFARNALRFGFTVKEIARFLRSRESGKPPCREVRAAAERLKAAMDARLQELTAARAQIERTLEDWDRRLDATPPGSPARLLEALPDGSAADGNRRVRPR